MKTLAASLIKDKTKSYNLAITLAFVTIIFAFAEAIFSTYYGYNDESVSLFGFGIGSFIEVISAIGIAYMIVRIKKAENSNRSNFEKTALRITGMGFYILVAGLTFTSIYTIYSGHKPQTTFSGVIISIISIVLMLFLFYGKTTVGKQLNSDAIIADAGCTKVCIYMSLVLLAVSGLYEIIRIPYFDAIGSIGIAYFSYKEGKECFEKAKSDKHCVCC